MDRSDRRRRNAADDMSTTSVAILAVALTAIMAGLGVAVYLSG